jgi:hypothetical protein
MMRMTSTRLSVVMHLWRPLALTLALTGGCGLISSDIGSVQFDLPPKSYSFDTAQAGWTLPATTLPAVSCSDATVCCTAATAAGVACAQVICDGTSGTCAFTATVETPPQTIDLKSEVPALSSFSSQSVIDVTISQIKYDVTRNTMNVALPPVELFVAPQGVTSASDARAKKFGTVPSTPAGMTVTDGTVVLDPGGQQAFVGFAHAFGTPFVFLSRTTVVVPGGTPTPAGGVDITIRGRLSANAL